MMVEPVRRISAAELTRGDRDALLSREWLVTNGLGGYASGTVAGPATRRYHGLLIAAHPAPIGRQLMLSHLSERVKLADGRVFDLSGREEVGGQLQNGAEHLAEFRLEAGLPVWRYEIPGAVLERRIVLPHEQNTVFVIYRLLEGEPVRMKVLPTVHNRSHDAPVTTPLPGQFELKETDARYELAVSDSLPRLRLRTQGREQAFTVQRQQLPEVAYGIEERRGYEARGPLWSPGYFRFDLAPEEPAAVIASTETWDIVMALDAQAALEAERERRRRRLAAADPLAQEGFAAELVLAADQFLIKPAGRAEDAARVHAEGGEVCTVIAGYHWFTDWGRDTMISLEGLTLTTGRHAEAGDILRMFGYYIRDGLIPNLFPEKENDGLYHTADATLWMFHALQRYFQATGDRVTLELLLPRMLDVAQHHLRGTRFGIGVDPEDGLLKQGAEGYQLTWMDAKVDDWVVTPRRGKAVEINALWYNAQCLLAGWFRQLDDEAAADEWSTRAERTRDSFNRRFWYAEGGYLYDVVDGEQGDDAACRPNQVLAISLEHPVVEREYWAPVLEVVRQRLLTPVGLRSLSSGHPDYCPRYYGDIRARDAAYHQGTVWGWLIGPFIDAWLKLHPDDQDSAREWLAGFNDHLSHACVGSISEIFDADSPFTPRGCIAQAWSVAEVLRCLVKIDNSQA